MTPDPQAVADAAPRDWTARLPPAVRPYAQLARWDRPIGWWLLLWPCWWSVAMAMDAGAAAIGLRELWPTVAPADRDAVADAFLAGLWIASGVALALFWIGAVAMRGAGCTWNDITDRHLDAGVARTRSRPLPSGRTTVRGALGFLAVQLLVGLCVLLALAALSPAPVFVLALGFFAVPVTILYPFAKRVTDWPQLVLGLAFSWGALMGWAVIFGTLGPAPLLLYLGCVAWTVGYDTIYAHQDREDDALVGVRSTARLFGERTGAALVVVYGLALTFFAAAFLAASVHPLAWIGLAAAAVHMARQIAVLDIDDPAQCLALFRSNGRIGWLVFGGLVAGAALRSL